MNTSSEASTPVKARKQPKERTSVFLDPGSLKVAAAVAVVQTGANPNRDDVSLSAVIREAITIGLAVLRQRHLPQPAIP